MINAIYVFAQIFSGWYLEPQNIEQGIMNVEFWI
jgi:hypothetical protein